MLLKRGEFLLQHPISDGTWRELKLPAQVTDLGPLGHLDPSVGQQSPGSFPRDRRVTLNAGVQLLITHCTG